MEIKNPWPSVAQIDTKLPYANMIVFIFNMITMAMWNKDIDRYSLMVNRLEMLIGVPYATDDVKKEFKKANEEFRRSILKLKAMPDSSSQLGIEEVFRFGLMKEAILMNLIKQRGLLGKEAEYSEIGKETFEEYERADA